MIRLPSSRAPTPLVPALQALGAVCGDMLLTSAEVAAHFSCSEAHLCNMRRVNKGPAWIKFSTGAVRYPLSEVLGYQFAGTAGPLTLHKLYISLSTMPGLSAADRDQIVAHVKATWPGLPDA